MRRERQVHHRSERPEDRLAVRELHLRAFGDHGQLVADLVDGLRAHAASGHGISLVAAGLRHESTRAAPAVFLEGDPGT